ncbi:hypothetical protein ALC60_07966, partial [Trachymyrmex zeteki]
AFESEKQAMISILGFENSPCKRDNSDVHRRDTGPSTACCRLAVSPFEKKTTISREVGTLSSSSPQELRHDAFVILASLKLNTLDRPTKCWHANRPRLSSSDDAAKTNRAIAKIARRVEEEAIARRIEVPLDSMPRCISYRAILPRRRGRPVLSVVSWPSSRGHSSLYHSLLDRKLCASRDLPFPEQTSPGGEYELRTYEQNLTSTPSPAMRAAVPAVAVCSRKKFRLHVCSASCSCYEVFSLSDRAVHVSRAHWPRDTTPWIPFLTACYRRAFTEQICTRNIYPGQQ